MNPYKYYFPVNSEVVGLPSPADGMEYETSNDIMYSAADKAQEVYEKTIPKALEPFVTFSTESSFHAWNGGYLYRQSENFLKWLEKLPLKASALIKKAVYAADSAYRKAINEEMSLWIESDIQFHEEELQLAAEEDKKFIKARIQDLKEQLKYWK